MFKRFHKYYHPKNHYFFIHITVDMVLILAVGSAFVLTAYLVTHPIKDYLTSGYVALPTANKSESISAVPNSEATARQKITRELQLGAAVHYNLAEGDQLGVGPLPPQVGESTKYWIFFSPSTNYFTVKDVAVTAELPANVEFTGHTSVTSENDVAYDEATRRISWQISELKNTEDLLPPGAAFQLAIIPTADQVGKPAKLLINIRITGQDSITKQSISAKISDLTTKINEDPSGGLIRL